MPPPVSRRRRFFVKKEFQGKFILLYASVITSLAGLATLQLYLTARDVLEHHLHEPDLKIKSTGEILFGLLLKTNIIAAIAMVSIVVVLSFIVFNRLNTQFYGIEKRLDAMSRGQFTFPPQYPSRFHEVSRLIAMVHKAKDDFGGYFGEIANALDQIETACNGRDPLLLQAGTEKLRTILDKVVLPD